MRGYWKCGSAKDAVAKVVVVNKPGFYDFKEYHSYFGNLDDAIDQLNRWTPPSILWKSVELYVKENGKWNLYKSE